MSVPRTFHEQYGIDCGGFEVGFPKDENVTVSCRSIITRSSEQVLVG